MKQKLLKIAYKFYFQNFKTANLFQNTKHFHESLKFLSMAIGIFQDFPAVVLPNLRIFNFLAPRL